MASDAESVVIVGHTHAPALFHMGPAGRAERFILFCDDLSFDTGDAAYKSLKAILDGGIDGRPFAAYISSKCASIFASTSTARFMPMVKTSSTSVILA